MNPSAAGEAGTPSGSVKPGEAGFTVLAVVLAVAVLSIALGVAVTRWSFIMKRHRETELVWRGEKYSRALDCFRQEHGTLPTRLEELVEERCIRRLYRDPMSTSGEWRILRVSDLAGEREAGAGGGGGLRPDPRVAGDTMSRSGRGLRARVESRQSRSSGDLFPDRASLGERVDVDRAVGDVGGEGVQGESGSDEMNGIVGVVSTSDDESIRSGGGRRYSDWRFMAGASKPTAPLLPGLSGVMGETVSGNEGQTDQELREPGSRTDRRGLLDRMGRGVRKRAGRSSGARSR